MGLRYGEVVRFQYAGSVCVAMVVVDSPQTPVRTEEAIVVEGDGTVVLGLIGAKYSTEFHQANQIAALDTRERKVIG